MEMNYVHLPMKRAIHAINPMSSSNSSGSSLPSGGGPAEHHRLPSSRVVDIRFDARPAHAVSAARTVRDCTAYLPSLVEQCFDRGAQRFIVTRAAAAEGAPTHSDEGREARFERGVEVLAWNGVPIVRVIEINGESQAGSNPDARFARGLDNLTIRPLNGPLPPDEHGSTSCSARRTERSRPIEGTGWFTRPVTPEIVHSEQEADGAGREAGPASSRSRRSYTRATIPPRSGRSKILYA